MKFAILYFEILDFIFRCERCGRCGVLKIWNCERRSSVICLKQSIHCFRDSSLRWRFAQNDRGEGFCHSEPSPQARVKNLFLKKIKYMILYSAQN